MNTVRAFKFYIARNAYVRVPVDPSWHEIAQTIRQHYAEYHEKYPDGDCCDENTPWSQHWSDMMEPRYHAHQCVEEILGDQVDFDFDQFNDYMDLEDALEALLDGRPDPMLVELETTE